MTKICFDQDIWPKIFEMSQFSLIFSYMSQWNLENLPSNMNSTVNDHAWACTVMHDGWIGSISNEWYG